MRRGNNPLVSGNAFKILSMLILAPGNNAELWFLGEVQHEKKLLFLVFFLEFGAIMEFRWVPLLWISGL